MKSGTEHPTSREELRKKIGDINLKYMHNTGWNGHIEAEVYQAAMDEVMQLVSAEVERATNEAITTTCEMAVSCAFMDMKSAIALLEAAGIQPKGGN